MASSWITRRYSRLSAKYQGPLKLWCWTRVGFIREVSTKSVPSSIVSSKVGRISLWFSACSHALQSTSMQPRLRPLIYLWNALVKSPMGSLELLSHTCILWMQQFTQSVQPREHWEHAWPWIVVLVGYDLNQAETFKLILFPLLIGQVSPDQASHWSLMLSNGSLACIRAE